MYIADTTVISNCKEEREKFSYIFLCLVFAREQDVGFLFNIHG